MTRLLAASSGVLLCVVLSTGWASAGPSAVFPEPAFGFGKVVRGTVVEHNFLLRNDGDAPLRIDRTRMSMPLLPTALLPELSPGQTTALRFTLDTSALQGRFDGWIALSVNDPTRPEVRLTFTGEVMPPIELRPRSVVFLAARRGEPKRATVEIINNEAEALRIENIQHNAGRLRTALETIEEGRRYRLSVMLDPSSPGGRSAETITVKTSSRRQPVVMIPAHTWLRERVYTFPETVDLGALRLSDIRTGPDLLERAAQVLMIYQAGGSDFRVTLQSDLPELGLTWERGPQGDRYQATLTLAADRLRPGPILGSIIVETNDVEFPRLVIPVSGRIIGP